MVTAGQAIAQAEAALRDAARQHKAEERAHRREARRLMEQASQLRALATAMGFSLDLTALGITEEQSDGRASHQPGPPGS